MQFKSLVLAAFAAAATSVQAAETCAAGQILGIYAMCGSNPIDCGSGKCCLEGQKCVKSGSSIACADSALQSGTTLTVNAACYGKAKSTSTSSKSGSDSSSPASATASATGSSSSSSSTSTSKGAGGIISSLGPSSSGAVSYPFTNGTAGSPSGGDSITASVTGGVAGVTGFQSTGAGVTGTGAAGAASSGPALATANAAISSFGTQSNIAVLLSAVGIVAFWL